MFASAWIAVTNQVIARMDDWISDLYSNNVEYGVDLGSEISNQPDQPGTAASYIANALSAGVEGLENTVPFRDLLSRVEKLLSDPVDGSSFNETALEIASLLANALLPTWMQWGAALASGIGTALVAADVSVTQTRTWSEVRVLNLIRSITPEVASWVQQRQAVIHFRQASGNDVSISAVSGTGGSTLVIRIGTGLDDIQAAKLILQRVGTMVTAFQQVVQGTTDYWGRSPWSDASLGKAPDPFYQVNGLVAVQNQNMVQMEAELQKRANYAKTVVAITPAGELYAFVDAAADNNPLAAALAGGGLVLTVAGTAYKITKSHNVGSTAFYKLDEVPNTGLSGGAARLADEDAFTSARLYELNPKHGTQPRIVRATFIGKRPTNPQAVLDNSVRIGPNTQRRIGYDPQAHEISIFDRDRDWWDVWDEDGQFQRCGIYHGHVRDWNQLDSQMKRALIDAGMFNRRGTYLGQ